MKQVNSTHKCSPKYEQFCFKGLHAHQFCIRSLILKWYCKLFSLLFAHACNWCTIPLLRLAELMKVQDKGFSLEADSSNSYVRMMYLPKLLFVLLSLGALCLLYWIWALMKFFSTGELQLVYVSHLRFIAYGKQSLNHWYSFVSFPFLFCPLIS